MKDESKILALVTHADGTQTRLHVCKMLRGSPRRRRVTYVVGYGVKDGCAYGGGNCHDSLLVAIEAFEREVAKKGGGAADTIRVGLLAASLGTEAT